MNKIVASLFVLIGILITVPQTAFAGYEGRANSAAVIGALAYAAANYQAQNYQYPYNAYSSYGSYGSPYASPNNCGCNRSRYTQPYIPQTYYQPYGSQYGYNFSGGYNNQYQRSYGYPVYNSAYSRLLQPIYYNQTYSIPSYGYYYNYKQNNTYNTLPSISIDTSNRSYGSNLSYQNLSNTNIYKGYTGSSLYQPLNSSTPSYSGSHSYDLGNSGYTSGSSYEPMSSGYMGNSSYQPMDNASSYSDTSSYENLDGYSGNSTYETMQ